VSQFAQSRHRSRERALEIAYEASSKGRTFRDVLNEQSAAPDAYAVTLLISAETHLRKIEELIAENATEWTIDRLAVIDRLIMTLALGELLCDEPPPTAVVLDEAVELAKTFSTEGSGSFVNGVLTACTENLK
jgi:N utilization substance protein B